MKVPGLTGGAPEIKVPAWHLLCANRAAFRDIGRNGERLEVDFEIVQGESAGETFVDKFFTSRAAVSRMKCFLSRAGYPKELLDAEDVQEEKVRGLRVWAHVVSKQDRGEAVICTDGWMFRAESDPPEEARERDYEKEDAEAMANEALEGLE